MVMKDLDKLAEDLERQELEAPSGVLSPQSYEQLLAIYLYRNDLCNAKYLWKRIPANVKASTAELGHIWSVAQHMWKRDFPSIYKALNATKWTESIADIMAQVQETVRARAVILISQAYSSIRLDTVAAMIGLTSEACTTHCTEKGWKMESDTNMVHPVRPPIETAGQTSSEDQLYKLTDFVSFLEN